MCEKSLFYTGMFSMSGLPCRVSARIEYQRVFHGVRPAKHSNWERPPASKSGSSSFFWSWRMHAHQKLVRFSTSLFYRPGFLVGKLALVDFQQGKYDGEKVSLFPFYSHFFPVKENPSWTTCPCCTGLKRLTRPAKSANKVFKQWVKIRICNDSWCRRNRGQW